MRFTTWSSTLTNAAIISTVALLSLAPAANAILGLDFLHPADGEKYFTGNMDQFHWRVLNDGQDLSDVVGDIFLLNMDTNDVYDGTLAASVPLLKNSTGWLTIPNVAPGNHYAVWMQVNLDQSYRFQSAPFSIHSGEFTNPAPTSQNIA